MSGIEHRTISNQGDLGMSLVRDYHEERQARLVRLGARSCRGCAELRSEMAEKSRLAEIQATAATRYRRQLENQVAALEDAINGNCPVVVDEPDEPVKAPPSLVRIKNAVARKFRVTVLDLESARRTQDVVWPRQIACYLCTNMTAMSLPAIGRSFGKRDHTTVLAARNKLARMISSDSELSSEIEALKAVILASCP